MAEATADTGRQVLLQRVYLKDASLEVPHAPQVFGRKWTPKVDVQVGTAVATLNDSTHQVLLSVTVTAMLENDVAFLAEVHQAGVFVLKGFDQVEERKAVLAGYCPNILFPFARETVASLVQRAGFPQILLQPINFEAAYFDHVTRQQNTPASPGAVAAGQGLGSTRKQ